MGQKNKEFEVGNKVKYVGPNRLEGSHLLASTIGTIIEKIPSSIFKNSYVVVFDAINDEKLSFTIPQMYLEAL